MARLTYRDRLQTLLDRPLTTRDRSFVESLLAYYNRKGKLTAGRARCVPELEERYSPANLAAAKEQNKEIHNRLSVLAARVEPSSWAGGFVESLQGQVATGARLSTRQTELLEKIEKEHNDDAVAERAKWIKSYEQDPTLRENARIAAAYYQTVGYFRDTATRVLEDDGFVPTQSQYNKMVGNKYAQKVLASHHAAPKYAPGSMVTFRASSTWVHRKAANGATLPRNGILLVIAPNAGPITSAAKGAKVYMVLPVGCPETILIEERHIMKARGLDKK
jgi:hypothetical protein